MNLQFRRQLAESISRLERGDVSALDMFAGQAMSHIVGITGSPGVGKSCLTSALVSELRLRGRSVAILAVDPTSPTTGGALLGDRLRMGEHRNDDGVYIRSIAARGHLGGTSSTTPLVLALLERADFDVIVLETVGIGQSEVDVAGLADSVVWVTAPRLGDDIQAAKAGVLEIADLLVVNKADLDGAEETAEQLRSALHAATGPVSTDWEPRVTFTQAIAKVGIADLCDLLGEHLATDRATQRRQRLREGRLRQVIVEFALEDLRRRITTLPGPGGRPLLEHLAGEMTRGQVALDGAVRDIVRQTVRSEP